LKPVPEEILLVGIDLAWGGHRPDGVCTGVARGMQLEIGHVQLLREDAQLIDFLKSVANGKKFALLAFDAPVVCPNTTGSRPVDRDAQQLFRKHHAGPHPCNRTLCPRPLRIVQKLSALEFTPGWNWDLHGTHLIAEVFPHPAIVRWGALEQIIKYKRGPVAGRRAEFTRLQDLLRTTLAGKFPDVSLAADVQKLLNQPWTKDIEDQTDALICLLIAWQHVRSRGAETEILGNLESGFILVPRPDQDCPGTSI
jgi:predicted RNase H-like nuclease